MNINMAMVISEGSPTLPTLQLTTLSVHRSLPRFLFQGLSFLSFSKVSFLLQGLSFLFQGLSVLFQGVSHRGPCFLFLLRCSWLHVGSYNFPIHALNKFSIQVSLTILSLRNGKRRPAGGNFNLIIFSGISCSRDLKSGVFLILPIFWNLMLKMAKLSLFVVFKILGKSLQRITLQKQNSWSLWKQSRWIKINLQAASSGNPTPIEHTEFYQERWEKINTWFDPFTFISLFNSF